MRGVEQRAERGEVAALEGGDGRVHAPVLAEHVTDAAVERVWEVTDGGRGHGLVARGVRLAERPRSEQLRRSAALRPALVVARCGEAA